MSMPTISDINPDINITREDAVNVIIASIAMEELALAHILNAEGEKLQYVLGTLKDRTPGEITICDIMAVNTSMQKTLRDVIKEEMLLQLKLEDAVELEECGNEECTTTIKGRIIWRDSNNVDKKRPPSIKIDLLRDGKFYKSADINSTGSGVYTFKCLPLYDNSGHEYSYSVDETNVPADYTKTIDGYNIINTIKPGTTTINGTKTWVDNSDVGGKRPPNITVNLLQNDIQLETKTIDKPLVGENESKFSFDNVSKFDKDGNLIVYTIKEEPVADYKTSIDGYKITNTIE